MISNSSPLIFLSKINQITLLKKLFGQIIIPPSVKEEILIEDKEGFEIINQAINNDIIKIVSPGKVIDYKIGKGENEAINLAIEKRDSLIIDDALGIKIAKQFNIETFRTTSIIFLAVKKKIIKKNEAIQLINKLL